MDAGLVSGWVDAYEAAWRSPGSAALAKIFDPGAGYRMSPYEDTVRGLEAIGRLWESEREGPDEAFEISHRVLAVDGDTAVVRVDVSYAKGDEYRDLWVLRFGPDGLVTDFEEWPFWPGQRIKAAGE
jgi:hypothetical protein